MTEPICEEVADAFLTMTPADFDDWLASKAVDPESTYTLIRSGYLAGNLTEQWAREHASPDVLAES
jgi:hypothetical protein